MADGVRDRRHRNGPPADRGLGEGEQSGRGEHAHHDGPILECQQPDIANGCPPHSDRSQHPHKGVGHEPGDAGDDDEDQLLPLPLPVEPRREPAVGHLHQHEDPEPTEGSEAVAAVPPGGGPRHREEAREDEAEEEDGGQSGDVLDEHDADEPGTADERDPSAARAGNPHEVGDDEEAHPHRQGRQRTAGLGGQEQADGEARQPPEHGRAPGQPLRQRKPPPLFASPPSHPRAWGIRSVRRWQPERG